MAGAGAESPLRPRTLWRIGSDFCEDGKVEPFWPRLGPGILGWANGLLCRGGHAAGLNTSFLGGGAIDDLLTILLAGFIHRRIPHLPKIHT